MFHLVVAFADLGLQVQLHKLLQLDLRLSLLTLLLHVPYFVVEEFLEVVEYYVGKLLPM